MRRLAVLTDHFPALSETFVANEVRELRRLGHPVLIEADSHAPVAGDELPARYMEDEPLARKAIALTGLVPRFVARDLRARRRWGAQEDVRPLRALAPRAARLRRAGVEHLHVHFAAGAALDAMRLARLLGVPWSVTAHAYDIFAAPANLREKLESAAFATSGCDYNVDHLRRLAPGARVHKVVMGVDPDVFRRSAPHPGGRHVVGVGRLVPKKGFADLIDAIARLGDDGTRLTLAGDGPLREELGERAARLGVAGRVSLIGSRTPAEVRALLETADVLAMPCVVAPDGDRDSMPVVVKEALAMEVPVVASDEVGLTELVRPQFGRLARPGDPADLAAVLRELLDRPAAERAAMGRAGRDHVIRHCDVRSQTARLSELIGQASG